MKLTEYGKGCVPLLCGGGQVAAQCAEGGGPGGGAQATGDLLSELDHADVTLGEVVLERNPEVGGEAEHVVAVAVEPVEQVGRGTSTPAPVAAGVGRP